MDEKRIRKQVYELTDDDLAQYPLWEFALDEEGEEGQDEATVRPLPFGCIPGDESCLMVGAATARLANGQEFGATLYCNAWRGSGVEDDQSLDALGSTQPQLIIAGKMYGFWVGELPLMYLE